MKLRDHPGFLDGWPGEPGGAFSRSFAAPIDRLDVLTEVVLQRAVGSDGPNVVLRTFYQGGQHTRDNRVRDDRFAEAMVRLLRSNIGRTIEDIGNLEVDF